MKISHIQFLFERAEWRVRVRFVWVIFWSYLAENSNISFNRLLVLINCWKLFMLIMFSLQKLFRKNALFVNFIT